MRVFGHYILVLVRPEGQPAGDDPAGHRHAHRSVEGQEGAESSRGLERGNSQLREEGASVRGRSYQGP